MSNTTIPKELQREKAIKVFVDYEMTTTNGKVTFRPTFPLDALNMHNDLLNCLSICPSVSPIDQPMFAAVMCGGSNKQIEQQQQHHHQQLLQNIA
ncbi:unnamed protein product [Ceratitis capitata]|uniref:(Mediterranean fruit fly) hypothetical protein n=1 Tax=Ceratitis capitata TaxID=7213 RepID=A0A811U306_CERCA|nr:unnamed protein product [Ceratitis capitata]